jgi:hypothetical protein
MPRILVSILFTLGIPLNLAVAQESGALAKFMGTWSCKGSFTSNGAPIAAELSVQLDERSDALIVRHDDQPPNAYHALEIWTMNKSGIGARAAIADKFSGMRWFETPGWVGGSLTWVRVENGIPVEQFAYEFKGENLQIEWSTARNGTMKLGDSVLCHRA